MELSVTKERLDELCAKYQTPAFIENDPIAIAHRFSDKNDIEIAAFLASTIAWGNRKIILRNAHRLVDLMDADPYKFVMHANDRELASLEGFVHRTFNQTDLLYFIESLRNIYSNHGGLGGFFESQYIASQDMRIVLGEFYDLFFSLDPLDRTRRHMSSIAKGSACKRLNMYLRWMVRGGENDAQCECGGGVDLGLWNKIPTSALYLPLDVHSSNVARKLGLLKRTQNDWKAVEEVTQALRKFDPNDPVKYDFALFSAGIEGENLD